MLVKAIIFSTLFVFAGCDITNVEGVPSAADVRARRQVAPFIVGTGEIEGLYDNVDVDAVVFSHALTEPSNEFSSLLRRRAAAEGWRESSESSTYVTFERFSPPRGTANMSGSEVPAPSCHPVRLERSERRKSAE